MGRAASEVPYRAVLVRYQTRDRRVMLYILRVMGVIFMILSPSLFALIGPAPALVFMCAGFGLLMPDVVEGLDMFRGEP